jgi:CRISPR-associated protein Csd1
MILQALYEYYQRVQANPDLEIADEGFEQKEIPFLIVLNAAGEFQGIEDTRETVGKIKRAKVFTVPKDCGRAANIAANLLWDKPDYILGYCDQSVDKSKVEKRHTAFKQRINDTFSSATDPEIQAVQRFLDLNNYTEVFTHVLWPEIIKSKGFLSFKVIGIAGRFGPVAESPIVRQVIVSSLSNTATSENILESICLITGNHEPLARLHPKIKGVLGAQTSGAAIISFNFSAAESYAKKQGSNAPVSQSAAFAYTTALNHLLRKDSRQKFQLGHTTVVFWAEKQHPVEDDFLSAFNPPDNPTLKEDVKTLHDSPWWGRYAASNDATRFYVLGLSPNAARIAIRFWHVCTIGELAKHIAQHFDDINIDHGPRFSGTMPLMSLLRSVAVQGKVENIPDGLEGAMFQSIIDGQPYPQVMLQAALQRARAEQDLPYWRAALIKGCINRLTRRPSQRSQPQQEELTVSLDESNTSTGYCLGRLFAVLEKIQEEANPGINATIRDRYYSSASSTPLVAFTPLMRLKNHHLAKLDNRGRVINLERLLARILEHVVDFPPLLTLQEQGRFAIGYYHQRQALFTKAAELLEPEHQAVPV